MVINDYVVGDVADSKESREGKRNGGWGGEGWGASECVCVV